MFKIQNIYCLEHLNLEFGVCLEFGVWCLEFPCPKDKVGHLPKLRPANLPNSLGTVLPLALVYSTCPPVSVLVRSD